MTIVEELIKAVRAAARYNQNDLVAPRVVLWPDGDRLWERLIPSLEATMPELLILDPSKLSGTHGPSTFLRYVIATAEDSVPVVYMPGVSKQVFRSAAGFPDDARHLFALQFQGQFWSQVNGKDWTPLAFLTSADGGLDLDVSRDAATQQALDEQLPHVMNAAVEQLHGQRITSELLHGLVADDPMRMLLQWMASDGRVQDAWSKTTHWQGFVALTKKHFKIDPAKDGVITAAEHLARGGKGWDQVWSRFKESPSSYAGLRQVLERIPPDDMFGDNERMPGTNAQQEERLREGLMALVNQPAQQARKQLADLVKAHEGRLQWVWCAIGEAPLAMATNHLGRMLEAMSKGIDTSSWESAAKSYLEHGWQVDAAAREAFAAVKQASDTVSTGQAVTAALRSIYLPWLEELATRCQEQVSSYPKRTVGDAVRFTPTPGGILLFVDGLRADLSIELSAMLEEEDIAVERKDAWSALPTVTATAKPAWAPMTEQAKGDTIGAGFEPMLSNGKLLRTNEFRALVEKLGWSYLGPAETGDPATSAWTEAGAFDRYGHDQGAKLAWRIEEELLVIKQRILEIFNAGWSTVHVLTDHGWLWMPGDLPKVDLPKHLTVSKWGRCAVPEAGAKHGLPQVGWFWGPEHPIVLAPNVCVFQTGMEYTHGGLSLQEALTPVLALSRASIKKAETTTISSYKWVGMRLQVQLSGALQSIMVDIRQRPADEASSLVTAPKAPDEQGKVSLTVDKDEMEGQAAVLVVMSGTSIVAKQLVTVGEN